MSSQWVVLVGDAEGNTGSERVVGPFRSEAKAYELRERIERHFRKAGIEPLADVYELEDWRGVVDEFLVDKESKVAYADAHPPSGLARAYP